MGVLDVRLTLCAPRGMTGSTFLFGSTVAVGRPDEVVERERNVAVQ